NDELDIMASTWLYEDVVIPTKNPNDVNLVLYYPFNADDPCDPNLVYPEPYDPCWVGTMWNDSQGSTMGYTWAKDSAPIVDGNDVPISDGNCIYMSGLGGGRITCGTPGQYGLGIGPEHAMTLSLWVKWLGPRYWDGYLLEKGQGLMGKKGDHTETGLIWTFWVSANPGQVGGLGLGNAPSGLDDLVSPAGTMDPFIGKWVHIAATYPTIYENDSNTYARIYVNGGEVVEGPWEFSHGDDANLPLTIGQTTNETAWPLGPASFWGYIDEVRIYDRVLEPNEVAYLADPTPDDGVLQIPIPSSAEIYTKEPEGQRAINFRDFAMLANLWLEEDMYP
ncbi:MAG: LamG domain-containing protein, partial [Sedimentisphaerales bacterium]|nr:LamG domain-containing protein [Sedimentisphaerales bacterium]